MKTLLVTGLSGTLAPKVEKRFRAHGWHVISWDHHTIKPDDIAQCEHFWTQHHIDAVCHMAMGSEAWAAWLAAKCQMLAIPYLFVSTAMVFDSAINGPYSVYSQRNANEDYGQYKIRCEDAIWQANPQAMIARIGWQIHDDASGNNMLAQLERQYKEHREIQASTQWFPATSHMDDTAIGFLQLIERNEQGLYHLDSNKLDKWSFYDLVCALKAHYKKDWKITANSDYCHDQRLSDDRVALPTLSARFGKPA